MTDFDYQLLEAAKDYIKYCLQYNPRLNEAVNKKYKDPLDLAWQKMLIAYIGITR